MLICKVIYFKTERGEQPVLRFLKQLDHSTKRKYWRKLEYLEQLGKNLGAPHSKNLGNGIHELRFQGSDGNIRILYFFFNGHYAIMTNGFKKKTNQVPKNEIGIALSRMKTFLADTNRYELGEIK